MKSLLKVQKRFCPKFVNTVQEAIAPIQSGDYLLMGGFGLCGLPSALVQGIKEKGVDHLTVLKACAGTDWCGPGVLINNNQVDKMVASYIGENEGITERYWGGEIEVELVPQGSLAERMRAAGAGIPAFYSKTGVGTVYEHGGFVQKYKNDGSGEGEIFNKKKETKEFNGQKYIMEEAIYGDVSIIKGWRADKNGNIQCRGTALNFNADVACAGKICIAEVEEIVENGIIEPQDVDIQSIYVDIIYQPEPYEKPIEFYTVREEESEDCQLETKPKVTKEDMIDVSSREKIARRVALEFDDGTYANVGIGIPTLASNYLPEGVNITLQSENGILGLGPYPLESEVDEDYTNASKQLITLLPGASLFRSSESFKVIRGGHVDYTVLGGMQVSETGDLANWVIPGKMVKGMGGAMDLVSSGSTVIVTMEHNNKKGDAKILKECTLPLTGEGVVTKIVTDIAVFDFIEGQLTLTEKAFWMTVEDIEERTEASFAVSPKLKDIEYSLV